MRSLDQVIAELPAAKRAKVLARGRELIAEEIALGNLRKARKLTQVSMAKMLGMRQDSVSKIERRSDLLLSTFRSYIEAMGGKLRLVVEFPDAVAEVASLGEANDDDDTPKRPTKPKRPHAKRPELVRPSRISPRRTHGPR
jgi:transcriptional regulator with XRE-family HTH domain